MIKHTFKYTPLAAAITLSVVLVGCDYDEPEPPPTPLPPVSLTSEFTFNTELVGLAVKGTMADSLVWVKKIEADGSLTDIAYRVAMSADAESYTVEAPSGTSGEELAAMITEQVLAANPTNNRTDNSGLYKIYLADNFNGSIVVKVKTMKEGDTSWLRCDAYTGCGIYQDTVSTVLPNDGDLNIEFGEWYKEALTLSAVKYIPAVETTTQRSFTTNVTVLTELAMKILVDGIAEQAINAESISDASLQVVLQLLGPDGVISAANLLGDISTGAGIDLSSIGSDVTLDEGTTALIQLASSLQNIAADGQNGTLSEIIANLAQGVADGNLYETTVAAKSAARPFESAILKAPNSVIVALATVLQSSVRDIAAIFVAIVTGDSAALADLGVDAGVITSISAALDEAVENGAITEQELVDTAVAVAALVDDLGCSGDDCIESDDLYTDIFDEITSETAELSTLVSSIADDIDDTDVAMAAAEAMESEVVDAQTASDYYQAALAVYRMIFDTDDVNELGAKSARYETSANSWVESAAFLLTKDSESEAFQALVTSTQALATLAADEAAQVNGDAGLHVDAQALLADARQKLIDNDAVEFAAKQQAEAAIAMAETKQTMTATAASTASSTYTTALELQDPLTLADATAFLAAAEMAVAAQVDYRSTANMFVFYAEVAVFDAEAYEDIVQSDQGKIDAPLLVTQADDLLTAAEGESQSADDGLSARMELLAIATAEEKKLAKLPMVKATTQSFADINVVTRTGRDVLVGIGEVMGGVIDEASREAGAVTDKASVSYPGWTYSFNEVNMTISGSHSTDGSFNAFVELASDGDKTVATVTWGALLNSEGATFGFMTGENCGTEDATGSCMYFTFAGDHATIADLDNAELLASASYNWLEVIDGETGFDGSISHMHAEVAAVGETPSGIDAWFNMAGTSGSVMFDLTLELEERGEAEIVELMLEVGDAGYRIMGSAEDGADLMGNIYLGDYGVYGDIIELINGAEVTYIDDVVVEYIDLDFTLD